MRAPVTLNKPYYVCRPLRAARRLAQRVGGEPHRGKFTEVRLPWGLLIRVHPSDVIGENLVRRGIYDLSLTEAIHRLVDPGDLVVDVGANIGYVTGLAATRVGTTGRVIAFEPHPAVFGDLVDNVGSWRGDGKVGVIELNRLALSHQRGVGQLVGPAGFERNPGSASLADRSSEQPAEAFGEVAVERLDDVIATGDRIGVLKIDVEGRELDVLAGGTSLLAERRIRDIVFEDLEPRYPTRVTEYLKERGYTVFSIGHGLTGLAIGQGADVARPPGGDPQNYFATLDPTRGMRRLRRRGWGVFGVGPFGRS